MSPPSDRDARGETPTSENKVEELFHAALEREPGEREAFLKEACAGDEALLREVTSLLEADERAERFIEQPAADAATQAVAAGNGESRFSPGAKLGPYEILSLIGAGGMGEVYRARDPRLSRDVAVKLITTDDALSPARLRRFETEARAAAQLSHPNVVTVFDVGTHEGHPYLVLELLEGETLREMLRAGVPLLRQAVSWALEVSRGLAAAHERGIVHRDLKPENIFLTKDGRVKVLDFGLAKLKEPMASSDVDRESPTETKGTSPGMVLGTVGYMSPEQVKAQTPDARSDVFALGAVLFELVTGRRAFGGETNAEALASILRDEPPAMESLQPGIPASLEAVVRRCLAKSPADRFSSGGAVEAALETVLASLGPARAPGVGVPEPRGPYPGLSAFTEADAERFFGREAEVESLWGKLRRDTLLALIGPSGAGKTSFVRAGLVAARPSGWEAIVATPGGAPMRGLGQALVGQLPSDPDTMRELLGFDDPEVAFRVVKKWRESRLEALLVVDQFEELFTLNPPEVQERFAALLGRLAREGDVRVLLSLRDDFLIRCHEHKALEPVFRNLTPILALGGDELRRALTEPAKKEGFSFEDESLADGMLESVTEARGALPLLAFAVSRLWEKRDREQKLLTRKAYEEIGGVAGALAQHAEQTMERIGFQREPIVRELFRNLVTAQWTRAAAEREELLSVLPDRETGGRVLDQLIDARLLTSYEVREAEGLASHPERDVDESRTKDPAKDLADGEIGEPSARVASRHRIEIVHESLLRAWPRLVRWQAQDEEGAVLRDQLKQAARLWEEKGRPDDLLWTGTSEREFELWQDRYPGKLTALEDEFAKAMVHRVRRRKRLLRTAAVSTIVVLLAVLAVIGGFWRRSVAEARRAEATHLFSLAQHGLADHPTEALAYAMASLDLRDNPAVRYLVLQALWRGPTQFRLPARARRGVDFSPDGRWLVAGGSDGGGALWPSDGGPPTPLEGSDLVMDLRFSPTGDLVAATTDKTERTVGLWSVPDGRHLRSFSLGDEGAGFLTRISPDGERIVTMLGRPLEGRGEVEFRSWPVVGGESNLLARLAVPAENAISSPDVDPAMTRLAWADGHQVHIAPLEGSRLDLASTMSLEQGGTLVGVSFDEEGRRLATSSDRGEVIQLWSLEHDPPELIRTLSGRGQRAGEYVRFDPSGSMVAGSQGFLWDLTAPPEAEPLRLQWSGFVRVFHPEGRWLATRTGNFRVSFWPLVRPFPQVLTGHGQTVRRLGFTPDGRRLVSTAQDGSVRLWALGGSPGERSRVLLQTEGWLQSWWEMAMAPDGSFVALGNNAGQVVVLPLDGGPPRELGVSTDNITALAVGPEARLVAAGSGRFDPKEALVRVWDLETGEVHILDTGDGKWVSRLKFTGKGELLVRSRFGVIRRWDLAGGEVPRIADEIDISRWDIGPDAHLEDLSPDGREILRFEKNRLFIEDLDGEATRELTRNLPDGRIRFDPTGRLVLARDHRGTLRVFSARGGEPHLLLGHEGVGPLAVSPDGRWIASGGEDGTVRLWPVPDVSQPPLHTLPHDELLAKLKTLTNLRAVRDPESTTGWTIQAGPFPGWEEVPTWFTPAPEWSARAEPVGDAP